MAVRWLLFQIGSKYQQSNQQNEKKYKLDINPDSNHENQAQLDINNPIQRDWIKIKFFIFLCVHLLFCVILLLRLNKLRFNVLNGIFKISIRALLTKRHHGRFCNFHCS